MMNVFTSEAWLQLTHKKSRLFISVLSVALSVTLMFLSTALRDGIFEDAVTIHKTLRADLFIQPTQTEYFWALGWRSISRRTLAQISTVEGVSAVAPFYFSRTSFKNLETLAPKLIVIFGIDPEKMTFNLPEINQQLDAIKRTDTCLYDRLSKPGYGPVLQMMEEQGIFKTEVADQEITVTGVFSMGGGILSANGILVTSDLTFSRLFNYPLSRVNLGLVTLSEDTDPQSAKKEISEILPNGIEVLTKDELMKNDKQYWNVGSPIGFIFNILAMTSSIFGGVIIYQILFTQITDYLSVYATFKAIGYTNQYLISTVLQESLLMAILGYIPGFIFCLYLFNLVENQTRLPMQMGLGRICAVMLLTIVMCFSASLVSLVKLKDADPADLFQ